MWSDLATFSKRNLIASIMTISSSLSTIAITESVGNT